MAAAPYRVRKTPDGLTCIDQHEVHGFEASWNPDDNRFYLHNAAGDTLGTFAEWRNLVQFARQKAQKETS